MTGARTWLRAALTAAVLALAAFLLKRSLEQYSIDDIVAAAAGISPRRVAVSAAFAAGSFACLSLSDTLAVRYAGKPLPYRRTALASFTAVSIGHLLGFAALSSGALRYRFYSRWGLTHGDVGRVLLFCGTTAAIGMATLGGLAAVVQPGAIADVAGLSTGAVRAAGAGLLAVVLAYLGVAASRWQRVRIRRFVLPVPSVALALGQVAIGTADMLCVSAVLHQLITGAGDVGYTAVAIGYVSANVASVVAHVPGGLGVVEAVMLSIVPGPEAAGGLLAFRAIYYLVPFALGCVALAGFELMRRRAR